MDNKTLQKGIELKEEIEKFIEQKGLWDRARSVAEVRLKILRNKDDLNLTYEYVDVLPINFEVLKALTLDTINKKLADLKKEYVELMPANE